MREFDFCNGCGREHMMEEKIKLKTIEGYLSFKDVKKEIKQMGNLIGDYEPSALPESVMLMNMRIKSMKSLIDLYEQYVQRNISLNRYSVKVQNLF